jgi:hypothetical protein
VAAIRAQTLELARRAQQTVSLNRVTDQDDTALAETVPDLDVPSPFDVAINRLLRKRLINLLTGLPKRERMVAYAKDLATGRRTRARKWPSTTILHFPELFSALWNKSCTIPAAHVGDGVRISAAGSRPE